MPLPRSSRGDGLQLVLADTQVAQRVLSVGIRLHVDDEASRHTTASATGIATSTPLCFSRPWST